MKQEPIAIILGEHCVDDVALHAGVKKAILTKIKSSKIVLDMCGL